MIKRYTKFFLVIGLTGFLSVNLFAGNNVTGHIYPVLNQTDRQFTENKGQVADASGHLLPGVLFVSTSASGINTFFFKNSFSYVIRKSETTIVDKRSNNLNGQAVGLTVQRIDVQFVNCNTDPVIIKGEQTNEVSNYYLAHCPDGVHVSSFRSVTYKDLYPGIDVLFKGRLDGSMEYDFVIKPGADPNQIQMKYTGANGMEINGEALLIKTVGDTIRETIPQIYQTNGNAKTQLKGNYSISEIASESFVSFSVPYYNQRDTLVIDPWVTYLTSMVGGNNTTSNNSSYAQGVTLDTAGNILVVGYTNSPSFPTTTGVFQTHQDTGAAYSCDIFVAKFDTAGHRIWATYYGGSNFEFVYPNQAIATDMAGNMVISAYTSSTDFPVSAGAFQTTYGGGQYDACIIKLDPTGNRLWATYCGGNGEELAFGISIDPSGNVVATGGTESTNFPVSVGAFQSTNHSASYYNAYFIKFSSSGVYKWSTYYGGSLSDIGLGLTTDKFGNIIMTSSTTSTDYPVSPGAYQTVNNGPTGFGYGAGDVVVVKLDPAGNRLWATYYGGGGQDAGEGVVTDDSANIYLTGSTYYGGFPTTPGVLKSSADYDGDAIAVKFSPSGTPIWSTCIGGTHEEGGSAIALGNDGFIYLCGVTSDIDPNNPPDDFPITGCAYQPVHGGGGFNWWFAKLDPTARYLCYSSYLGGKGQGDGYSSHCSGIAYAHNTFYLCGYTTGNTTSPSDFPVTPGAFDTVPSGSFNNDGVLAAININTSSHANFSANHTTLCAQGGTVDFTNLSALGCSSVPADTASYTWYFSGGNPATSKALNPAGVTYNSQGTFDVKLILTTPCSTDSLVMGGYITVSPGTTGGNITSSVNEICKGDSAQLNFSGSGNIQWQASLDDTSFSNLPGAQSATYITPSLAKTEYYRAFATGGCGTDTSLTFTLTVNPPPGPPALTVTDSIICASDSTIIRTSVGYASYLWSDGDTTSSTTVNEAGNYWVTVTNANGCATVSNHREISVYPVPSVSITVQGDTLSSFNAVAYQWLVADTAIAGATNDIYIAHQTGDYSLEIVDSNGCHTTSNSVHIVVNGLEDITGNNLIRIYPDPVSHSVFVQITNGSTKISGIEIYDILGERVISKNIVNALNPIELDFSGLPDGVYFAIVLTGDEQYVKKLIKQH